MANIPVAFLSISPKHASGALYGAFDLIKCIHIVANGERKKKSQRNGENKFITYSKGITNFKQI